MSTVTIRKSDGQEVTFKNTIGHQIGNGAIQVMKGNGEQVIFNNFIEVEIKLNAKEKVEFKKSVVKAEANAEARIKAMEAAQTEQMPKLSAVKQPVPEKEASH